MSNSASDIESTPQQEVATQTAGQTPVLSAQSAPAPQPQPALASSPGSTDPTNAPGVVGLDISARTGADVDTGSTPQLAWGARSDVGLIREHNEDSFLIHAPVFCVCDGMGGHAAGEVASAIAVRSIAEHAPVVADDTLLGAAVELANTAIIKGAQEGVGRPGMGCTATAAVIENKRLAVAHVGDSRLYILHEGTLVRVTRDTPSSKSWSMQAKSPPMRRAYTPPARSLRERLAPTHICTPTTLVWISSRTIALFCAPTAFRP